VGNGATPRAVLGKGETKPVLYYKAVPVFERLRDTNYVWRGGRINFRASYYAAYTRETQTAAERLTYQVSP
jgi:hypothetical protein